MDLAGQAATFALTVITGALLGLLFDFYRVLRQILRPGWLTGALADLAYWLVATLVVFVVLLLGNWGEIRLYVFIGLGLGALAYYRLFSRWALCGLWAGVKLAAGLGRAVARLVGWLLWPIGYLVRLIAGLAKALGRRLPGRRPPDPNIPP